MELTLLPSTGILLGLSGTLLLLLLLLVGPRQQRGLPPGPKGLPLLGNALQLDWRALPRSLTELSGKYGPIFTVWFGRRPAIVLCGSEVLREALLNHAEAFGGREPLAATQRVTEGYGMTLTNGERWKQLRRFSIATLRNFGMGKKSVEQRVAQESQALVSAIRDRKGQPFDPSPLFRCAAANVVCSIVFGQRFEYTDERFIHLLGLISDNLHRLAGLWGTLYNAMPSIMGSIPGFFKRSEQNGKLLKTFVSALIEEHKVGWQSNCPRDYIDCFIDKMEAEKNNANTEFTPMNMLMSVLNLFMAGTETTARTLESGIQALIQHPQLQEKMQQEMEGELGQDRTPTYASRLRLPLCNAVVHEIHRYGCIAPTALWHRMTRDTQFKGFVIPKDTLVIPMICSALNEETKWGSPGTFDPGNFLDADGRFLKNDAFMPFSTGKRACLGEALAMTEVFTFITSLVQSFNFRPGCSEDPPGIGVGPLPSHVRAQPRVTL